MYTCQGVCVYRGVFRGTRNMIPEECGYEEPTYKGDNCLS